MGNIPDEYVGREMEMVLDIWLSALWDIGLFVLCLLVVQVLYRYWRFESYPGVKGLPILGHIHYLFPLDGSVGKEPVLVDWIADIIEANNGYFLLRLPFPEWIPSSNVFCTTDPKDVEYILKDNFDNYIKGDDMVDILDDFLGNGIFNTNGESWLQQRKAAAHQFSVSKFRDFMSDVFIRHSQALTSKLDGMCSGGTAKEVRMQKEFSKFTLQSIGEIGFGVDLGCIENDVPFESAFDAVVTNLLTRFWFPWWKISKQFGWGKEPIIAENIKIAMNFADDVIKERRLKSAKDIEAMDDLLSRFMSMKNSKGKRYDDKYLRYLVLNFILAGRDTTASCLAWLFYLLAKTPRVEKEVRKEIAANPDLYDGVGSYAVVKADKMPYLHATITEVLRLQPPVPSDFKCVVNDDVLPSGHKLKAGWSVDYFPYAAGRMTKLWGDDAREFRPERFLEVADDGTRRFEPPSTFKFSTFQAGRRICLGVNMAYLETKIAAIQLLTRYKFTLSKGFEDRTYKLGLTMPVKDLRMDVQRI